MSQHEAASAGARANATSDGARLKNVTTQAENPFAALIPHQSIAIIPRFTLESGVTLHDVPVAYTTRGQLSPAADNALVICHALTGSADVADWWGPLLGGAGRAFDTSRFFLVCLNSLGSPYGSASPVTNKHGRPELGLYGPEFPLTTIRDDVRIHKLVVDDLGVRQIAAVVGGSMGGMLVLEWAYFGTDYVRTIVPIATCSRHSAWGISWGEAQRQAIYCDPRYADGYYGAGDPPAAGLGAARMSALLTYRSRDSFEARFGRNVPDPARRQHIDGSTRPDTPPRDVNEHWSIHNDGHRNDAPLTPRSAGPGTAAATPLHSAPPTPDATPSPALSLSLADPQFSGTAPPPIRRPAGPTNTQFSAQSYLRYQGQKFVKRFDSNCYIAITRKLDTHDISRDRVPCTTSSTRHAHAPTTDTGAPPPEHGPTAILAALARIRQPTLVLGIQSDGLFTFAEQQELARGIPDARLRRIDSPEGHDAFLLQFEQVNRFLLDFFREVLPDIMRRDVRLGAGGDGSGMEGGGGDGGGTGLEDKVADLAETSVFGEAEVGDITAW